MGIEKTTVQKIRDAWGFAFGYCGECINGERLCKATTENFAYVYTSKIKKEE